MFLMIWDDFEGFLDSGAPGAVFLCETVANKFHFLCDFD